MKKTILIFGSIAGFIVVAMLFITIPLYKSGALPVSKGEVIGYTTMVIAMTMIFFGVKSCRDNYLNGIITFGLALKIGLLIAGVASIIYVIGWEIDFRFFNSDFAAEYAKTMVKKAHDAGATAEKMKKIKDQMAEMEAMYKNVFIRMAITFIEIFPVGLVVALVTASTLRKKETFSS